MEEDNDAPSQPVRSRGMKAQRTDNQPRNGNNQPSWAKRRRKSQDGDAIPTGSSFTGHAGVELPPETAYDCKTWRNTTAEGIKSIVDPCLKEGGKKPNYAWIEITMAEGTETDYTAVNEKLKRYLRPQQATITSIQDMCWEFLCNFPIMSNEANIRMLKDRSYNAFDGDKHFNVYKTPAPTPTAVSIIAGESGGGKTVEAIASVCRKRLPGECLRFYCLASDLSEGVKSNDTSLNENEAKTERNKQCVDNLKAAMRDCFDKNEKAYDFLTGIKAATDNGAECTLGIVVDEAGGDPQVVRALCSIGSGLGKELGLKGHVTVQVVVAGTGVGSSDLPPGSAACSYTVHILSTTKDYWEHISNDVSKEVIDCINCHERAPLMIRNPRFARVLLSAIESVSTTTVAIFSDKTARDFVNLCLAQAASKFKSLNGLDSVDLDDVLGVLGSALRIALLRNTPPTKAPDTAKGEHDPAAKQFSTFITKYGMVVDTAKWIEEKDHNPNYHDVWAAEKETGHLKVSAKGKRFSLSLAHSSILLVLLELVPRRSSLTGESLESCVASLFPVLISAFRSRTVGEMLKALQIECTSNTIIPDSMVVWSKQYQTQGNGVLNDAKVLDSTCGFNKTDAYVVTNGPKYPFADIVVLIPKTAMILIQCKDYGSPFKIGMVKEELAKMFHPKHTLKPKQYVKVMKPQKQWDAMTPDGKKVLKDEEASKQKEAMKILEEYEAKVKAISELKKHFGITDVVYAFVGSKAKVMEKARLAYLKDPKHKRVPSHIVCFGGLSGVTEEPLKSIIAFDDTKAKDPPAQPVGTLGTQTSLRE